MGAISSKTKMLGLGWGKSRLSRCDIRAEGAPPPGITDNENNTTE